MALSHSTQAEPCPQSGPALDELAAVFEAVNASPLLAMLHSYRANGGRPGYPVLPLWRAYLASFVLNLASTNHLIRQLEDDADLRALCGFGGTLPHRTTFNRFVQRLSRHPDLVELALAGVTNRLKEQLPGLGNIVAVDSTAMRTHSNPNRSRVRDQDAKWGVKHSAKAKDGKTEFFFGYKVHAVADAVYGVPLAQVVTAGNRADSPMLPAIMDQAASLYDWWGPRVATADRGYDSSKNHHWLDDRGVLPVIHIRKPTRGGQLYGGIYTKEGVPTCLGMVPMEYAGTDAASGQHLFICREGGCPLKDTRKGGTAYCGDEVWEDPAQDLRLFGKLRRNSPEWKAYYRQRYSIERVFKTLKESRRLERHFVRGLPMITLHAMMSVLAFQATALAWVLAGEVENMRWMVRQVA